MKTQSASDAYFRIATRPRFETFVVKLVNPEHIAIARHQLNGPNGNKKVLSGQIDASPQLYNPGWTFHIVPGTIEFTESPSTTSIATVQSLQNYLAQGNSPFSDGSIWTPQDVVILEELPPDFLASNTNVSFHLRRSSRMFRGRSLDSPYYYNDVATSGWIAVAIAVIALVDQVAPNWVDKVTGRRREGGVREDLNECVTVSAEDIHQIIRGELRRDQLDDLQDKVDALLEIMDFYRSAVPDSEKAAYLRDPIFPRVADIMVKAKRLSPEGLGAHWFASAIRILCYQEGVRHGVNDEAFVREQAERFTEDLDTTVKDFRHALGQRFLPTVGDPPSWNLLDGCQFDQQVGDIFEFCYKLDNVKYCHDWTGRDRAAGYCTDRKQQHYFAELDAFVPIYQGNWSMSKASRAAQWISIRDWRGRFVEALNGGGHRLLPSAGNRSYFHTFERKQIGDFISLRTYTRQFVSAERGINPSGSVYTIVFANCEQEGASTRFQVIQRADGRVALKGYNGKYVRVSEGLFGEDRELYVNGTDVNDERCHFQLDVITDFGAVSK